MRWIIVTGLPATGKSTLARQLAARYQLPLLAKDDFKERLMDGNEAQGPVRSRQFSDISFTMLFTRVGELARASTDALLDGNFRAGEHEAPLRALPAAHIAQVLCRVDENERRKRIALRTGDAARHPGHGDAMATRDASNDRFLDLPGARLLLDTSTATTSDELLLQLDQWWRAPTSG